MSVFGAPGAGEGGGFGIHITPLIGPNGELHGISIGSASQDLAEQSRQAAESAAAAKAKARSLYWQSQKARVGEVGDSIKSAAMRVSDAAKRRATEAEQAPRVAACKTLPSEVIDKALEERKAMEAAPKSPSRMAKLLGRS